MSFLHSYQEKIVEFQLDEPRNGTWAGMGLGKTLSTLTTMDSLSLTDQPYPALVAAPLRVAQSTWPDEVKKWKHLSSVRVVAVTGSVAARRNALKRPAEIYTTNYENLPWLIEELNGQWPFKTVVADESTRLKSFRLRQGGSRAMALGKVAFESERFIELTGTPSPNGLQDLWGQAWFLDRGQRLGKSFAAFTDRWFRSERVGASAYAVSLTPYPHAQTEIQRALSDICLSLDARDYFDIDQPIESTVHVDLPPAARRAYEDMEKRMYLEIGDQEKEAFNAAAKTLSCLQLASGAIYMGEGSAQWEEVHDLKLQALESIVAEAAGAPVLVAYHFKSDLARLMKAFPKARHLDADPQTITDWNAGKIPMLLAHPASAGHGLNLQDGGNILVMFSHWWNLEEYQQIVERIGPTRQMQAGHPRPVFIYHIVARDTVDELVMARRKSKQSVQDILLSSMKRGVLA